MTNTKQKQQNKNNKTNKIWETNFQSTDPPKSKVP
jgi:hypothetical protein